MDRLTTLVRMRASELAMSIPDMGHAYAMKHAGSSLSPVGRIQEICGGMTQVSKAHFLVFLFFFTFLFTSPDDHFKEGQIIIIIIISKSYIVHISTTRC